MKRKKITVGIEYLLRMMLNILPVVFWLCLIYSFDNPTVASITVLAMIIHEFGHIACIFILTGDFYLPRGDLTGLRIVKNKMATYLHQLLLYASGIISNLVAVIIVFSLPCARNSFIELFITINLATALSNLLPVEGYDGYKILVLAVDYFNLNSIAYFAVEIISFTVSFVTSVMALFFVYNIGNGYWIMGIFVFTIIIKLQKWQKHENERI